MYGINVYDSNFIRFWKCCSILVKQLISQHTNHNMWVISILRNNFIRFWNVLQAADGKMEVLSAIVAKELNQGDEAEQKLASQARVLANIEAMIWDDLLADTARAVEEMDAYIACNP